MGLHDFLARSLDLLTLLAEVEQRQAAIAADLADLEASSVDNPDRGPLLTRLAAEHRRASSALDRALVLLSGC